MVRPPRDPNVTQEEEIREVESRSDPRTSAEKATVRPNPAEDTAQAECQDSGALDPGQIAARPEEARW